MTNVTGERRATVEWNTITAKPPIVVHPNDGMPIVMDFADALHGELDDIGMMTVSPAGELTVQGIVDGKCAFIIPDGGLTGRDYSVTVPVRSSHGFWVARVLVIKVRRR
jgi:hypothetical protein